ncbi:zinc-dependent metalloprotease [Actinocrinis puniceicyclus]|uniref:Zinc-dependent metalloprotease n=1 Tax=Actinocrinis puniceicyclus TaxID=977794 RepID=A0A8J7WN61_9ACTN|nr:zinc-dependent metalloprotease [Actinocrinis puniceicyclus]MBS2962792.1 zinc-dependent metalloprotease [Actinocrinis puniceicyclus]
MASEELIDWSVAEATARRLVRPGPAVGPRQAEAAVAELRRSAQAAQGHVRNFAKLDVPDDGSPVLVVDRGGWVNANLEAVQELSAPLAEKVRQWREGIVPSGLRSAAGVAGAKLTGVELGSLLAYLSHRVLGQYDPFGPGDGTGRLLLVAPNIVQIERELGVDPTDFRLWVCLHEETHRVQFGAVPWLREHILGEIGTLIAELEVEPAVFVERVKAVIRTVMGTGVAPSTRHADVPAERVGEGADPVTPATELSLLDMVRTPAQRAVIERLTAVMTLLEGHATYVMDGVGPLVVPSVAEISREFGRRRSKARLRPEALLRKLLGLDAKMRQYRDGERFVRSVVDEAGIDGFNRVWTSPNTLPTQAEIGDPAAWIRRVPLRRG